ncbi:unnamed protein product [Rhizopus stolonifer]
MKTQLILIALFVNITIVLATHDSKISRRKSKNPHAILEKKRGFYPLPILYNVKRQGPDMVKITDTVGNGVSKVTKVLQSTARDEMKQFNPEQE